MNSNTLRCDVCDRCYIAEEFNSHICEQLSIVFFDTDGNRWGSYDRINVFKLPPFRKISDENLQGEKDDENRRRLDRTIDAALSSLRRVKIL